MFMTTSIILGQVLGLFFIIMGFLLLLRKKFLFKMFKDIKHDEGWLFLFGVLTSILGLLIIFSHNIWQDAWRIVITLIGWITLLKGLNLLFFPEAMMKTVKWALKTDWVYIVATVFSFLLGSYLLISVA